MPARILDKDEISLNGVFYPIVGRVQQKLVSEYPEKLVIGDVTKDSHQRASVVAWNDWQGGIGIDRMTERDPANRAWWSTADLRFRGHLVLPPLVTTTASSGLTWSGGTLVLAELNGVIYGAFGTSILKYDNANDTWNTSLATLPGAATDAITIQLNSTTYMIFATDNGYTYTTDGSTFTDDTKDTRYLAFWDNRLWGIDNAGQLWRSTTVGTETNDAVLPLPSGYVTSLFSARNAAGSIILFCGTKTGLYTHNLANATFEVTEFGVPFANNNCLGAVRWRDSIYLPANMGVYKYINGTNSAIVALVGPDRDHGVPTAYKGKINKLIGTHNQLMALVDGTTTSSSEGTIFTGEEFLAAPVLATPTTGQSSVLAFNERGWQVEWLGTAATGTIDWGLASSAYDSYRFWWSQNQRVYWMALPTDIINPDQVTTYTYAAAATHDTPWLTVEAKDVTALAISLSVEVQKATATETVIVSYATDYVESFTALTTITTNGTTTFKFPNSTTPTGTAFRAIRFRVALARGGTTTLTPDVVSMTFLYRKKLTNRWGHQFTIQLDKQYKGSTARQLRDLLATAVASAPLIEFTFRDDADNTENFYVDILNIETIEEEGHDYTGQYLVTVAEP